MMPQVDGWEMLRRVQERHGVGSIPVIMFSGKVEEEVADEAAASRGAQGFIGKPFNPQQLIESTKQLASGLIDLDTQLERWVVHHRAGWLNPIFVGLLASPVDGLRSLLIAVVLALVWRRPWFLLLLGGRRPRGRRTLGSCCRQCDRPRAPAARYPEPQPLVPTCRTRLVPVGPRGDELRLRGRARVAVAALAPAALRARRADRVLARLRRRALPARRARRARSSESWWLQLFGGSQEAGHDHGQAASRLIQIPIPRPSGGGIVGDRDQPDQHEDRRERAERDHDEALGDRRRQLDPELAQHGEHEQHATPRKKTSLPSMPVCQPITAIVGPSRAGVPVRERREREHEPGDPGQSAAERPEAGCGRADEDLLVDLDERLLLGRREGLGRLHHRPNSCSIWFQITTARPTLTQSTATSTSQKRRAARVFSRARSSRARRLIRWRR